MNRSIENRLARLENVSRAGRQFVLWDNSPIDPQFDLEAEKDRFRRERGMRDDDEILVISWLPPAEPNS